MARLLFWQLVRTGLAVWALASVVFLLSYRDLNTAARLALPDATDLVVNNTPAAQQAAQQAVLSRLGLGLPLFYVSRSTASGGWRWHGRRNLYHRWAARLLRGDLGTSFRTGRAVSSQLRNALAFTLPLTGTAAALAVLAALGLAQSLAARPWWHRPVRGLLVGIHALPLFVVALALLLAFANPEVLAWFPAYGLDQAADEGLDQGSPAQHVRFAWTLRPE